MQLEYRRHLPMQNIRTFGTACKITANFRRQCSCSDHCGRSVTGWQEHRPARERVCLAVEKNSEMRSPKFSSQMACWTWTCVPAPCFSYFAFGQNPDIFGLFPDPLSKPLVFIKTRSQPVPFFAALRHSPPPAVRYYVTKKHRRNRR